MAGPISLRQWNRTLLQRQHLLERVDEDVLDVLDRCVGLQSQDPRVAFFGLWSRITDFDPADLDDLMTGREVVRMALLRSTVFLMDSEDARWVRPLAQASMDGEMRNNHVKHLAGADPVEVAAQGRELLSGTELSVKALKEALSQRWPDAEAGSLVTVVRCLVPLVQVPPRGTWEGSATTTYSLYDDWCGPGGVEAMCAELVEQAGVLLLPASIYTSELTETPKDRFRLGVGRSGPEEALAAWADWLA